MLNEEVASIIVGNNMSTRATIEIMDKTGKGIALIIDSEKRLVGTVTDGDVRRAILKGISLDQSVIEIMNPNFTFVTQGYSSILIENLFKTKPINQIPVLDDNMTVVDVVFHHQYFLKPVRENYAIIMAGGLGTRLHPLTNNMPKPMLKVGAKPLLETIIDQLKSYGFINIIIAVNYKAEIIENYFQDGSNFGVKISYIREKFSLGTGGAVKLAEDVLKTPFFLINGDLLTKMNFEQMLDYHISKNNCITLATRKHELQIPYGVVEISGERVTNLKEKPTSMFFINGGIYCINPETVGGIPKDAFYNITDLIEQIIMKNGRVGSFPIREYWMDIGQMNDYQQANIDYYEVFEGDSNGLKE